MPRKFDTAVVTIGIDPGKNTMHLVGLDARGEIVLREKVARTKIVSKTGGASTIASKLSVGKSMRSPRTRSRIGI